MKTMTALEAFREAVRYALEVFGPARGRRRRPGARLRALDAVLKALRRPGPRRDRRQGGQFRTGEAAAHSRREHGLLDLCDFLQDSPQGP